MKLYFTDQQRAFKKHLDFLKTRKVMTYDQARLTEKTTTIDLVTAKTLDQINLNFLLDYQVFPANILTFSTQWADENRRMRIGDTIAQQVFLPPIKTFSQKIIFGVRISEVIDQADKKGFSYETLEGHVEKGISIFSVEQAANKLLFKIQTFSTPGNFLTALLGPVFSVRYQTFCTKAALENVKRQIEAQ